MPYGISIGGILSRALRLNHTFLSAYINRANAHEVLGDLKHAETDFDQVLQLDPMNNAAIINRLGVERLKRANQTSSGNSE